MTGYHVEGHFLRVLLKQWIMYTFGNIFCDRVYRWGILYATGYRVWGDLQHILVTSLVKYPPPPPRVFHIVVYSTKYAFQMFFIIPRPPDQKRMSSLLLNDVFACLRISPSYDLRLAFAFIFRNEKSCKNRNFLECDQK